MHQRGVSGKLRPHFRMPLTSCLMEHCCTVESVHPMDWASNLDDLFLLVNEKAMQSIVADLVGLSGTALVVGAFFLLQLERLNPKKLTYNLMNLSGAILLLISLCINFNLASFIIELFWIGASVVGIVRYFKREPEMSPS